MKIYFVSAGKKDEVEVIRRLKPANILVSFFYFRNIKLSEFVSKLGLE